MKKKHIKQNLEIEINYWRFIQFLHENNFIVTCNDYDDRDDFFQTKIEGNNIKGFMWLDKSRSRLYSGVAIDNRKCWNKIADCPFKMKIPKYKHFDFYLRRFMFWGSKKGYRFSNNFDYSQRDLDGT